MKWMHNAVFFCFTIDGSMWIFWEGAVVSQIQYDFLCEMKVLEFIREGKDVAELMDLGRQFLGR
jgi:hypothetical protein